MRTYQAAIVGIGGFGAIHTGVLAELAAEGRLKVAAFAEKRPDASPEPFARLTELGAAHYEDYERMLEDRPELDFVVLATPIAAHKPMSVRVLQAGFHVLVEKPPAVTIQDLDDMVAAQRASGRLCQVDFQNTAGRAFRELLDRLKAGEIGKVTDVTGVGMWQRTKAYYARTAWAGKLIHGGQYVLDGTFNNPFSHLLNNCLLAAGAADPSHSLPVSVQAELYHVNDIEGDDASCLRIVTAGGATVRFYAMLSHERNETPYIRVRGTEGEIVWHYDNRLVVRGGGGDTVTDYGRENLVRNMYLNLMEAIETPEKPLYSPLDATRSFVLAANGAYESAGAVRPIAAPYVVEREAEGSVVRLLPELSERMKDVADRGVLYSEYPFPWAAPTRAFRLDNYRKFELPPGFETQGSAEAAGRQG